MVLTYSFWVILTPAGHKRSPLLWTPICPPQSLGLKPCLGPYVSSHMSVCNLQHYLQSIAPKGGSQNPLFCGSPQTPPPLLTCRADDAPLEGSIYMTERLEKMWGLPPSLKGKCLNHHSPTPMGSSSWCFLLPLIVVVLTPSSISVLIISNEGPDVPCVNETALTLPISPSPILPAGVSVWNSGMRSILKENTF